MIVEDRKPVEHIENKEFIEMVRMTIEKEIFDMLNDEMTEDEIYKEMNHRYGDCLEIRMVDK